jgi:bifunctional non-homologous end joining protein LigD
MTLTAYRKKRHFDRTAEPSDSKGAGKGPLRFVVQKHAARRLHYDFRLQLGKVLKSWAVPKGPSLNPADRRLAVQVEDHPFDYRAFEGVIPKGNYGAGSVIVWDEGTYSVPGVEGRKATEAAVAAGLAAGHVHITLHGRKLRGDFSLVRMKRGKGTDWLLLKKADDAAAQTDVTSDERSVKTGRTLADVSAGPRKRRHKITIPTAAPRRSFPHKIKPMLAMPVAEPFDGPGWLFEIKWDGYRAIAEVEEGRATLYSRNHKSLDRAFAPIVEALRGLGHDAVLDGEVVVIDESGRSGFQLLQNYQKTGRGQLAYYVFDLLHLDGRDLRRLPLVRRKEVLAELVANLPKVRISEHVESAGVALFKAAMEKGLEGVVAKDGRSPYREGRRGREWLKIKTQARQEAVIGGFTKPRGSRTGLGALLLGVYDDDELVYIGHAGGGLGGAELVDLRKQLDPLVQAKCPFIRRPRPNAPVQWVEPSVVCEVTFKEWTGDGIMRQPIFVGMRSDKPAHEVRRENPQPLGKVAAPSAARNAKHDPSGASAPLTHPDKVLWPADGYTKRDMAEYYSAIASVLLPYLRDRPQSLHRYPNGIDAASFFQKDVTRQPLPDWVETVVIPHENGRTGRYVVCQDERTLLYLANLGCIELNPWNSRIGALDRPDYLVIDLDPEATPFVHVIKAASAVRRTLDAAGAACYCKTSGKTGLHVYVPLRAKYETAIARQFAEVVANIVNQQLPKTTSVLRRPGLRQGRVYLDYLQNRYGQTVVAPYSVRPVPGACVSAPLTWAEVRRSLNPARFTIRTMARRLDRVGDLWRPVLGPPVDVAECLERLTRIGLGATGSGRSS